MRIIKDSGLNKNSNKSKDKTIISNLLLQETKMFKNKSGKFVILLAVFIFFLSGYTMMGEKKEEKKNASPGSEVQEEKTTDTVKFSKEKLEKLPLGRDFLSIMPLVPGINHENLFDGISVTGASSAENRYYIDGIDTTSLYTGESGMRVNIDFIDEVQVRTSGLSAEYEGSTGGVIHVVTRGGGNEFHGAAMLYFDGSALNGKPRPALWIDYGSRTAEYATYPEDTWTRLEPGLSLGGYIVKDKLWFFSSFMPKFVTTTRDGSDWPLPGGTIFQGRNHVSGSNEFTRKDTFYAGSLKLTAQPAKDLKVTLNGIWDYHEWKGELPPVDGTGDINREYSSAEWQYPVLALGGSIDYNVADNLRMSLKAGYYRSNEKELWIPDFPFLTHLKSNADIPGIPPEFIVYPIYWFVAPPPYYGYQITKNINTRLSGSFDLSYDFDLAGEHTLKAGFQAVRQGIDKDAGVPRDVKQFYWCEDYRSSTGEIIPTTMGYLAVVEPLGVVADVHGTRSAFYLQDTWTIAGKLTLNLGIRAEKEDIPSFTGDNDPVIRFGFSDKLAPRVGFSYDLLGDSSLTIFGGFGVYYDVMKMALPEDKYGGYKYFVHYYDIVNWDWISGFPEAEHPQTGGYGGGQYFESINRRPVSFDTTQPDLKPFRKDEFTFGIRKTLGDAWTISATFLHNYIVNAIEDIGIPTQYGFLNYIGNPGSDWIQEKFDEAIAIGSIPEGVRSVKAVREYTSLTINLDRKFKNNWFGGLSYTWSRLYGNYSGLVSSDHSINKEPNLQNYFDEWFFSYNQYGEESLGLLRTDRTHRFKCYGAYAFDFGLAVGFNAYAMSGIPLQTDLYLNSYPGFYPLGRAGEGRTPWLWQIDLYAEYNIKVSDRFTLQFNVNVTNLTDNDVAQAQYMRYHLGVKYLYEQYIKDGFNYIQALAEKNAILDPRYKMEYDYMDAIAARLGVKLMF